MANSSFVQACTAFSDRRFTMQSLIGRLKCPRAFGRGPPGKAICLRAKEVIDLQALGSAYSTMQFRISQRIAARYATSVSGLIYNGADHDSELDTYLGL